MEKKKHHNRSACTHYDAFSSPGRKVGYEANSLRLCYTNNIKYLFFSKYVASIEHKLRHFRIDIRGTQHGKFNRLRTSAWT